MKMKSVGASGASAGLEQASAAGQTSREPLTRLPQPAAHCAIIFRIHRDSHHRTISVQALSVLLSSCIKATLK